MATKTAQQETKGFYRLSWLQRIGFGSGDLAQNLIYQTICMYLLFFYTDIFGLKPGHAATMFLVVRLVDVLWDPLVGTYVDKHNPRWGKYRSYLVLAGIPLTALAILCFWDGLADSDYTLKLCYAYVTYVGMSMLYTLINVPYGALNSSLTRDTNEITILTSVRMFMANVGGLCVSAGVPILVAVLALGVVPSETTKMALFMGLGSLPSFIFMPLVPAIKKKVGKKNMFYIFLTVAIIGMALGGVVPGLLLAWTSYQASEQASPLPKDSNAWFLTMLIFALVGLCLLVFCFSQTKERVVMDERETKNVKVSDLWTEFMRNRPLRVIALFFITAFAMMSVGNAAGAYFMNDLELQTPEAQEGIRWLVCIIPAILLVLAMWIISKYELTDEKIDQINKEIEERNK